MGAIILILVLWALGLVWLWRAIASAPEIREQHDDTMRQQGSEEVER